MTKPTVDEAITGALDYAHDCAANELRNAQELYGQYPRDGLGRKITHAEDQLAEVKQAIDAVRSLSVDAKELDAQLDQLRVSAINEDWHTFDEVIAELRAQPQPEQRFAGTPEDLERIKNTLTQKEKL